MHNARCKARCREVLGVNSFRVEHGHGILEQHCLALVDGVILYQAHVGIHAETTRAPSIVCGNLWAFVGKSTEPSG